MEDVVIASFVGEHVVVAPNKAFQGITVVAAAAISAVAAVEDAALKGFAAMCFALVEYVKGWTAMIVEAFVAVVPAVAGASVGGLLVLIADTASRVIRAEKNSYHWKRCFAGIGYFLSTVAAEVENI
jgi:hypothetical protein